MSRDSSMISLVVPGTGVTIAASRRAIQQWYEILYRKVVESLAQEIEETAFSGIGRTEDSKPNPRSNNFASTVIVEIFLNRKKEFLRP